MLERPLKSVKYVVVITGTPCVGKTSVARLLAERLNALYLNLTELATRENLILGIDEQRNSLIIDEAKMRRKVSKIIKESEGHVVVDGHYAASVISKRLSTYIFVLRRSPIELKKLMEKRGFSGRKLWENLASEILDVCLFDALKNHGREKVCELDVTGKSEEAIANEIIEVLAGAKKCRVGVVDWLGLLEKEGLTEEYLKI